MNHDTAVYGESTVLLPPTFYAVARWSGGITERGRKKLDKQIKSSVLGCHLDSVDPVCERRIRARLSSFSDNSSHPLYKIVETLLLQLHPFYCPIHIFPFFIYAISTCVDVMRINKSLIETLTCHFSDLFQAIPHFVLMYICAVLLEELQVGETRPQKICILKLL